MDQEIGTKVRSSFNKPKKILFSTIPFYNMNVVMGTNRLGTCPNKGSHDKADMPEHAKAKALEEFEKLKKTPQCRRIRINRNT